MNISYRIRPRATGRASALLIGLGLIISSPGCYPAGTQEALDGTGWAPRHRPNLNGELT